MLSWDLVVLTLAFIYSVSAGPHNITIDDTFGDGAGNRVNYNPASAWENQDCVGCFIKPDPIKAHQGTWTAATYNPSLGSMSLSFDFHGSAVYLFFILANTVPSATTETLCNFTIDGAVVGNFHHVPTSSTDLQYDQLVFSKTGLGLKKNHTVQAVVANQAQNYWLGFDFAVVTDDDTPTPTPSATAPPSRSKKKSTPVGAIVGAVIGGLVLIAALVALFLYLRRSKKQRRPGPVDLNDGENGPEMTFANNSIAPFLSSHPTNSHNHLSSSQYSAPGPGSHAAPISHRSPESVDVASTFYNPYSVSSGPSATTESSAGLARRATVRDARQRELEAQVAELRSQLLTAQSGGGSRSSPGAMHKQREADEAEKAHLRNQVGEMQQRLQHLEAAQSSSWAQGYSDEPPPGYEPVEAVH